MAGAKPDPDPSIPARPPVRSGSRTRRGPAGRARARPAAKPDPEPWTAERVRALGVVTDLRTAARILGLSANTAYALVKRDAFPVPVVRCGNVYRVSVEAILTLGLPEPPSPPQPSPALDS